MESTLIAHFGTEKITRADLRNLPVPPGTGTFKPIPHHEVVEALVETLGFRKIGVVRDEYAASADGMKMFGVMDLESGFEGCRFSIGIRNANDKSMRLALTVGYRVFVCDNLAFQGDFTPVLAKHSSVLEGGQSQTSHRFRVVPEMMATQIFSSDEYLQSSAGQLYRYTGDVNPYLYTFSDGESEIAFAMNMAPHDIAELITFYEILASVRLIH